MDLLANQINFRSLSLKDLLEAAPADWLRFLGRPDPGPVRLIDADLSTVTT